MISSLGLFITRIFRSLIPDPFVIAVALTLLTVILALLIGDFPSLAASGRGAGGTLGEKLVVLLDAWKGAEGIWKFLAFAMQMCVVLVTGHALAETPIVRRAIRWLASIPTSTGSAAALVACAATVTGVINWGLALIVGALMAREVGRSLARKGVKAHYPLIVASGYTGLMIWHGGLSGSAPLSMTTIGGASKVLPPEAIAKLGAAGVPLSETIFSSTNLIITGGLLVIVPLVLALAAPRREGDISPIPARMVDEPPAELTDPAEANQRPSLVDRLESSRVVNWAVGGMLLLGLWRFARTGSMQLAGLDEINALMLALGLLLHGSMKSYLAAAEDGVRGCTGIILQFPLYAGIMSMTVASGLIAVLARGMVASVDARGIPVMTFWAACVVNLFVPSGGGQWGVQGPIALETALQANIPLGKMVMAVAYGDQTTNMLQPFWALPLLAITGARARDIVGYTALPMLAAILWISAVMYFMA